MRKNYLLVIAKIILFSIILTPIKGIAQVPTGYYGNANGLSGENLKTALYNIIKGHTEFSYTSSSTDVWDILKETDRDPDNSENVILLYTGWSVNAAQEYNHGNGWTREHVWSKSHGDFGTSKGPGTDVHHLRPCDGSVNSAKNNKDFDEGGEEYFDNGIATGCYSNSESWTWEPRDAVKGDVARMIFYMAVRYEGENGEPDLELVDYTFSSPNKEPLYGKKSTLLQWNIDDPVDDWERNRNNIIYNDYQHNRNPFIDHPEYADAIWGTTTLAENTFINEQLSLQLTTNILKVKGQCDDNTILMLFDMGGRMIISSDLNIEQEIHLNALKKGVYIVKLLSSNSVASKKISLMY